MRPICVHCGKPYGQRWSDDETVTWPLGEPMPKYRGNKKVIKVVGPWRTGEHHQYASRYLWDGERYLGLHHKPFCTLRCALSYARKAYNKEKLIRKANHAAD